jgi:hypothetical protein
MRRAGTSAEEKGSENNWLGGWLQPSVIISLAALLLSWHTGCSVNASLDHKLKGVQDSIRFLASLQAQNVQNSIEKDLDTKVVVPKAITAVHQDTAKQLAKIEPSSMTTWKTVAAVADYKSAAYSPAPFPQDDPRDCRQGTGPLAFPMQLLQQVSAIDPNFVLIGACTLHLDDYLAKVGVTTVVIANATVFYKGTRLPNVKNIFFYNCVFRLEPSVVPDSAGQKLLLVALEAERDKLSRFQSDPS